MTDEEELKKARAVARQTIEDAMKAIRDAYIFAILPYLEDEKLEWMGEIIQADKEKRKNVERAEADRKNKSDIKCQRRGCRACDGKE